MELVLHMRNFDRLMTSHVSGQVFFVSLGKKPRLSDIGPKKVALTGASLLISVEASVGHT